MHTASSVDEPRRARDLGRPDDESHREPRSVAGGSGEKSAVTGAHDLHQRPGHSPLILCVEDEDEVKDSGGAVERARFDSFAPYDLLRVTASHPGR